MKLIKNLIFNALINIIKTNKKQDDTENDAENEFKLGKTYKCKKILTLMGLENINNFDKYYLDCKENLCFFLLGNRLKSDANKISKQITKDFLENYNIWKDYNVLKIGLILWLQEDLLYVDIPIIHTRFIKNFILLTQDHYKLFYEYRLKIGQTITLSSLKEWIGRTIPIQIFLSPNISSINNKDDICNSIQKADISLKSNRQIRINTFKNAVLQGLEIYVHSSYNIKLADRVTDYSFKTQFKSAILDLIDSNTIGAKGVVVHVGHNTMDIPIHIATSRMKENVIRLLNYATEKCPLLIETPAAQGQKISSTAGEMLSDITEMIDFYLSIPEDKIKKLGICIDTCHVFAAGYNPIKYIEYMHDKLPGVIKLVHFNDSMNPRYCKIDHHYHPGGGFKAVQTAAITGKLPPLDLQNFGYIGIKCLTKVAKWCIEHNIPMVTE